MEATLVYLGYIRVMQKIIETTTSTYIGVKG